MKFPTLLGVFHNISMATRRRSGDAVSAKKKVDLFLHDVQQKCRLQLLVQLSRIWIGCHVGQHEVSNRLGVQNHA